MKARVEIERNGETVSDSIWKDRKQFSSMAGRGHRADKIRLTVDLESAADMVALIDWCNIAHLCFKK